MCFWDDLDEFVKGLIAILVVVFTFICILILLANSTVHDKYYDCSEHSDAVEVQMTMCLDQGSDYDYCTRYVERLVCKRKKYSNETKD